MSDDERQLRWLEDITAADVKSAKKANETDAWWAARPRVYAAYMQAVERVVDVDDQREDQRSPPKGLSDSTVGTDM